MAASLEGHLRANRFGAAFAIYLVVIFCPLGVTSFQQVQVCRGQFGPISPLQSRPRVASSGSPSRLFVGNDGDAPVVGKGTARISGPSASEATSALDYGLSLLSSDVASIILGLLGLIICLWSRLSHLDYYDSLTFSDGGAVALGTQSRADLLGIFAALAVLLNGVSKLDVTSALAESVVLDGVSLDKPVVVDNDMASNMNEDGLNDLLWALGSILDATPARTVVLMMRDDVSGSSSWRPTALAGIVPADEDLRKRIPGTVGATPILDRFLKSSSDSKESYLPTLQALPGRVEFTYLPANAQEALLVPVPMQGDKRAVLVLGSETAKSCTPRDVAWCQVLATQMGNFLSAES